MIHNKTIVFLSTMRYHELPTRKQRIARFLSESNRVLYIEPPSTYLSTFVHGKNESCPTITPLSSTLLLASLPTIFPLGLRYQWIHALNQKKISQFVHQMLLKYDLTPDILWFYLVDYPELSFQYPDALTVYDCVDDHSAYPGLRSPFFMNRLEKQLVASSDVVFATTKALQQKMHSFGKDAKLVPNGVDYPLYQSWNQQIPAILQKLPRPIVGYIGALKEWFDVAFILRLADALPHCSFVLAGPCSPSFASSFSNHPRILLPGAIQTEDVPSWIGSFDACLIPFLQNNLTLHISPLKFFEYCAMGKPCITIPIHQLEEYKDVVYTYHSHAEGIEKVKQALQEKDPVLQKKRISIAKEASWEKKFSYMFDAIEQAYR
jgi:hypothetical protein